MASSVRIQDITLGKVAQQVDDGVFVIDVNRQVVFFSDGCERITGTSRDAVVGSSCACHDLTACRDEYGRPLSGVLCPATRIFGGEATSYRQRMTIVHQSGHRVWIETVYSPVRDDNGRVIGVVGVMRENADASRHAGDADHGAASEWNETERAASNDAPGLAADDSEGGSMGPLDKKLTALERREILNALQDTKGQRTLAAQTLGISRSRLYRRMETLGIDPRSISTP